MDQYVFCFVLCAVFYSWVPLTSLGRSHRRLDVVVVEVLLEVEVRERRAILNREELLERRIRLDVVLVLEVLLLHVVVDRLRDLRAGEERVLGLAEEREELLRDLRRALEDRENTGLRLRALDRHRTPLALAGILDLAVDTLVELLDLRKHGRDRLLERVEVERHRLEVLIERRRGAGRGGNDRRLNRRRGDNDRRGGRGGNRLLGLHGLLGNRGNGRRNGGGRGILLSNLLRGGGLGGGGVHYTGD